MLQNRTREKPLVCEAFWGLVVWLVGRSFGDVGEHWLSTVK